MSKGWVAATLAVAAVTVAIGRVGTAWAGVNGPPSAPCSANMPPDCGGTQGDLGCLGPTGLPDPTQDCVALIGGGCGCEPRVCCSCKNVGSSTDCTPFPCQDTAVGVLLGCVLPCFLADGGFGNGTTCNLDVVFKSQCSSSGDCPTTGCCTFQFCANPGKGSSCEDKGGASNLCAETDATTCGDTIFGTFLADGVCDGLFGGCVTKTPTQTPTSTPTSTATATATSTATRTATSSATPTNTRIPNGGGCATPSQCQSGFCVDGVCCDTLCTQQGFICNGPTPGVCAAAAAKAPAMSRGGLLIGLAVLILVGAVALVVRVRPTPPH